MINRPEPTILDVKAKTSTEPIRKIPEAALHPGRVLWLVNLQVRTSQQEVQQELCSLHLL